MDIKKYLKFGVNKFLFILFFTCINISSQNPIKEDIVEFQFQKLIRDGDFKGAIYQENINIEKYKILKYKKEEIRGYINIAKAFNGINKNKESFKFLEKADSELKNFNNDELKAYLYHVYGVNFYSLGLHARAINSFDKALIFSKKIKDKTEREKRQYTIYDWKRSSFEFLGLMDSVYSNEKKCMKSPMPMLYIDIAQRHFKNKNIDSAEYYINKANNLLSTKQITIEGKSNVLRAFGELYLEKKNYKLSLDYLIKSLAITQKAHLGKRNLESYKLMAAVYHGLKDPEKENEFLTQYAQLKDSLQVVEGEVLNISVEKNLIENEKIKEKDNLILKYIICAMVIFASAAIVFTYVLYKRKQNYKDFIIIQQNKEKEALKGQVDTAAEEVIQLAIKQDPAFITRFKQLYPEFCNNLNTYPGLTSNDIRLCAFIKLNFSNKEIAEYANISVRTVESQKYRLRVKIGLSPGIDLNKWVVDQ
ncbi:transcriptional regulator [Chryseobacterium sp. SIMBA_038]|uniref:transcriptional regulator n=1 Tax=Chryseobacterium sp. SIMBA_038 TaxID=3085780 RepID=UPI00397A22BD